MDRNAAFGFISRLVASQEALASTGASFESIESIELIELTNPVTISLRNLIGPPRNEADLRIALDWWVHVGGTLREQFESNVDFEIRTAENVQLELTMRCDPVVAFEVSAWIEKRQHAMQNLKALQFATRPEHRDEWTACLPALRDRVWKPLHLNDEIDVMERLKILGLEGRLDKKTAGRFVKAMRDEVRADFAEPPWVFWSRLPGWLNHQEKSGSHEIELLLSIVRSACSPQDEQSEFESLASGIVMLNPTFETAERPLESPGSATSPLIARARRGDQLTSRFITALEAQVLDHVRESFRSPRFLIVRELEAETGTRKEFVDRAVDALRRDGFLLARD